MARPAGSLASVFPSLPSSYPAAPIRRCLLACLLIVVTGCGGGSGSQPAPPGMTAPSNLAYAVPSITATVGTPISPDLPTVTGAVTSYSISPALPSGLTFNTGNGSISGTPNSSSSKASYTVSARNPAGATSAALQITVVVPAPASLTYPSSSISAIAGQPILPDVPAINATELSFSISPALPAGMTFDLATGVIAGTPASAASPEAFTVTAQNSGGAATAVVNISILAAPNSLLDLGHANQIEAIRMIPNRVLSVDTLGHWVLWDYSSSKMLAAGDGSPAQISQRTVVLNLQQIDMAGSVFAVEVPNGLQIFSTSDGHPSATLPYPGLGVLPSDGGTEPWWQLALDGSYLTIGSSSGLSIYSPAGKLLASKPGDYSSAQTVSAPAGVQVALGPAGPSVIETISIADGSSTVSPPFSGQFHSWFTDGGRFLTNEQNTVWTYSAAGQQQAVLSVPSIDFLAGEGNWIVAYGANTVNYPLAIYPIGSATPALTWSGGASSTAVLSGNTLAVQSYGAGKLSLFDLSGSTPTRTDYSDPLAYLTAYASDSSGHWIIGNQHGALVDGASLATTARPFGFGQAWSIAGSSSVAAVSTASGKIPLINSATAAIDGAIDFPASKVSLSSDGNTLAAMSDAIDSQYEPDRTLNLYSLSIQRVIQSFPYTYQDEAPFQPFLVDFTLSNEGNFIAQTLVRLQTPTPVWKREIAPLTGSPIIWSDSPATVAPPGSSSAAPILLSPDGTLADVYAGGADASYTTNIYQHGTLITAISGIPVGWIDNNRILVNQYTAAAGGTQYAGAVIYDSTGVRLATPALPELKSIQTVTPDSVYDPSHNAIYSLTTGQPTWTAAYPGSGLGAVAGPHVFYEAGHTIISETY